MNAGFRIDARGGLDHPATYKMTSGGEIIPPDEEEKLTPHPLESFFRSCVQFVVGSDFLGVHVRAAILCERLQPSGISDAELARRLGVTRAAVSKMSRRLERLLPELCPPRRSRKVKVGAR